MDFFGVGPLEVILVLLIAFILFGPKRMIEMSKSAGKAMSDLSKSASALNEKLNQEIKVDGTSVIGEDGKQEKENQTVQKS
jgi:sec-independent protein translocase protein TatA